MAKPETTTAPTSHRLIIMRAAYALCSFGARYEAVGSAAQRDAHRAHKAAPVAAPAVEAKPAAKPRIRKARPAKADAAK